MKSRHETVDVLIAGGGTAGHVAAIQAARAEAKTSVIEAGSMLGGTMTAGGVYMPNHSSAPRVRWSKAFPESCTQSPRRSRGFRFPISKNAGPSTRRATTATSMCPYMLPWPRRRQLRPG